MIGNQEEKIAMKEIDLLGGKYTKMLMHYTHLRAEDWVKRLG